jgi:anti-sigma factor RsiW
MFERLSMTHATDGLLQAYLDGEIDAPAAAGLREHLASCDACASELRELERVGARVRAALDLVATPPPMLRARAAIAARRRQPAPAPRWSLRRLGASGLAKAAMLLLALAGAGAAAIPGSPVRRALEGTFARVAQLFNGAAPAEQAAQPGVVDPVVEPGYSSAAGVLPAEGRVRVLLYAPSGAVSVTVRTVDAPRAQVQTEMRTEGVRFRSGAGRLEVLGLGEGEVTILIPRTAQGATIEVDGRVYVYKQGDVLHLSGPGGRGQGDQVRFQLGT